MQRYLKSDKKTFEVLAAYQKIAHENLASILDLFYDGGFFYAVENFAEVGNTLNSGSVGGEID